MRTTSIILIGKIIALLLALSLVPMAYGQSSGSSGSERIRSAIGGGAHDRKGGGPVPTITAACYSPRVGSYRPAQLTIMTTDGAICGYYGGSVYLYYRTKGSNGPWRGGISPSSACYNPSTGAYTGMLRFPVDLAENQEVMVTTERAGDSRPTSSSNLLPVLLCSMTTPQAGEGKLIALKPTSADRGDLAAIGRGGHGLGSSVTLRWIDTADRGAGVAYRVRVARVERGASPADALRSGRSIIDRRLGSIDELSLAVDLPFDSSAVYVWSVRSIDPSGQAPDDSVDDWAPPITFTLHDIVESPGGSAGMAISRACLTGRLVRVSANLEGSYHGRSLLFRKPGGEWSEPAALLPSSGGLELMFQLPGHAISWPSIEVRLCDTRSGSGGSTSNIMKVVPCPAPAPPDVDPRRNVPLAESGRVLRSDR